MGRMFDSKNGWATEYNNIVTLECVEVESSVEPFALKFYLYRPCDQDGKNTAVMFFMDTLARTAVYTEILREKNSLYW